MDNDKDFDYVPPTDLSLEEAEDDIEEYEGSPSKVTYYTLVIFLPGIFEEISHFLCLLFFLIFR